MNMPATAPPVRGAWGESGSRPGTAKSVHFKPHVGLGSPLPLAPLAQSPSRPVTAPNRKDPLSLVPLQRRPKSSGGGSSGAGGGAGPETPVKREKKHPTSKELAAMASQ